MAVIVEGERPRYAAALLRLLLALRREPEASVEELIQRVIEETGVEAASFRAFLAARAEIVAHVAVRGRGER